MYIYIYMHTYHVCIYIYIYVYVCTYLYIYIQIQSIYIADRKSNSILSYAESCWASPGHGSCSERRPRRWDSAELKAELPRRVKTSQDELTKEKCLEGPSYRPRSVGHNVSLHCDYLPCWTYQHKCIKGLEKRLHLHLQTARRWYLHVFALERLFWIS